MAAPLLPCATAARLAPALSLHLPCVRAGGRRLRARNACCALSSAAAQPPFEPPVLHVVAPAAGTLAALVATATGLADPEARALINLGAVYAGTREAPVRVTKASFFMAGGAYLRIHARPRRYAAARAENWGARVLHRERGMVFVDKPRGLPVTPGVDNARECVAACVAAALRCAPLRVVHRLDNCTSGVLALAETKDAAQRFGALQLAAASAPSDDADQAVPLLKLYSALVAAPVALGPHACWVLPGHKAPGVPRRTLVFDAPGDDGRVSCAQDVVACAQHAPGVWEVAVRLRTGRTHQIRALLAHRGAPVVGDTLYGAPDERGWREPDAIALHAGRMELNWGPEGERRAFAVPPPWASALGGD